MLLKVQLQEILIGFLPIHAGPEIGVASTKAFLGQMIVLFILSLKLAKVRKEINESSYVNHIKKFKKFAYSYREMLKSRE